MAGPAAASAHTGPRPRLANTRRRARFLFLATLFFVTVLAAQLLRVQGFDAAAHAQKASKMRTGTTKLPALRGAITDMNGVALAQSEDRYMVVSCPRDVRDYKRWDPKKGAASGEVVGARGAAKDLAPLLKMTEDELFPLLDGSKDECYKIVKRGLTPLEWRAVEALHVAGISYDPADGRTQRTYPGGAATSPIVGWVGSTGEAVDGGGGGLELMLNDKLKGVDGSLTAEYSINGQVIPMADRTVTEPVPGQTVKLTLDRDLQWYAYNGLADLVQKREAKWGTVVVMDKKGKIRAAAQYPSFDSGDIKKDDLITAVPFQSVFDPGSTAKVMSIGAALDKGVTSPTEAFTVPPVLRLPGFQDGLTDMHAQLNPRLTTTGILAKSSNVGTVQIVQRLSAQELFDYQRSFGMGQTTAVDFQGESGGFLTAPDKMDGATRFSVMFGQGFSATAAQVTGIFQTVANGGVRISPTLVEGTTDRAGTFTPTAQPEGTRVLSPEANAELLRMMTSVTRDGGTAATAAVPGYTIAGKTGTGDIFEKGVRTNLNTISMVGMAPAEDPQLVVGVFLYRPTKDTTSNVAPLFKSVMTYGLQKFQIPPAAEATEPYPITWGGQAGTTTTR